ncbi:MAG: hypothetical protein ACTTJS_08260, partial [Wolinella sp.]
MQPSSAHAEANSKNIRLSFSKLDNEITKETSTAIFNTGVIKSQRIYLQKAKRIASLKAPS